MKAKRTKQFLMCLMLCSAVLSAVAWQHIRGGSGVYRGRFTDSFETSRFVPCGSQERWWTEGNLEPIYKAFYPEAKGQSPIDGGHVGYVKVQGEVSSRGIYGHMGQYGRQLTVQKVLEVQLDVPDSCE